MGCVPSTESVPDEEMATEVSVLSDSTSTNSTNVYPQLFVVTSSLLMYYRQQERQEDVAACQKITK